MKKSILISIALISVVTLLSARQAGAQNVKTVSPTEKNPADTSKSAGYKPDPTRIYDIHLQLTADQINVFLTPESTFESSDKLTGAQITQLKAFIQAEKQEINKQLYDQAKQDYLKWQADTAKVKGKR